MINNKRKRSAHCLISLTFVVLSAVGMLPASRSNLLSSPASPTSGDTASRPATGPPSGTYFDHLVFIIMENEGLDNICGMGVPPCSGSNSPYMSGLANSYGLGLQYLSLIGTSQPNYVGIMAASIQNCTSSCGSGTLHAVNLVDRFESAGLTWKGYMENQNIPAGCDNSDQEPYEALHNPFVPFYDIDNTPARCAKIVLANPALNSTCTATDCALINDLNSASAPNFMWLTPNDCDNMHASSVCSNGCSSAGSSCIKAGDNYLKSLIPNILNSYTFQHDRTALFVTFDEGQGFCPGPFPSGEDCLYTVWAGPVAKGPNFTSGTKYNHYSFTKTIEANWALSTMTSNDAGAKAMTEFFQSQPPDFSISANPNALKEFSGATSNSTITVSSLNGFSGTITLTASSSPTGPTLKLNPPSVSLGSGGSASSVLTMTAISTGNYTITVVGANGSLSHNTAISIMIQDFSITSNPTSLKENAGSGTTSTITIFAINHFTGTVSLTLIATSGLITRLSLISIAGSGASTLTVNATTPGNYTATVIGTSASLNHNVTVHVQVADFSLTSKTFVSISQGHTVTLNITVSSLNGFKQQISLTDNFPIQLNCGDITPSLILGSSLVTIACTGNTIGQYNLMLTGTSGTLSHSLTVTVNVTTGSVGGLTVPIDRLQLISQYAPIISTLIALIGLGTLGLEERRQKEP